MFEPNDLKGFWEENSKCFARFSVDKPRVPLVLIFEDHFLSRLVPMESTFRYYNDPSYALDVHAQANDVLEREIGRRCYPEHGIYYIKGAFEVLMGAKRIISEGNTPWLESEIEDINDVKKLIRFAEGWTAVIPDEWKAEKEKLHNKNGKKLLFAHSPNGPATMACNILGTTNLCLFMMESPEVMDEFFEVMARKYIEFYETAQTEDNGCINREGLGVNDDNCYIFPPRQYERFCAPFLERLLGAFAPSPGHLRRQHSDSAMGHLIGILNDLGVNEVNFGPEIHPLDIRKVMPNAVIHGQVPPFVLRNGTYDDVVSYVKRDFEAVGGNGGLVSSLAGVVPESTPFSQIRGYMYALETYARY